MENNLVLLWTNLIVQVYYLNVVFVTTWCCFEHNCPSLKFQDEMGNLYLQVHGVLLREYLKTCHGTILLRRFRSDYKVLKIKALCYLMSTYCLCFRLNFKSDCHLWFSFQCINFIVLCSISSDNTCNFLQRNKSLMVVTYKLFLWKIIITSVIHWLKEYGFKRIVHENTWT